MKKSKVVSADVVKTSLSGESYQAHCHGLHLGMAEGFRVAASGLDVALKRADDSPDGPEATLMRLKAELRANKVVWDNRSKTAAHLAARVVNNIQRLRDAPPRPNFIRRVWARIFGRGSANVLGDGTPKR